MCRPPLWLRSRLIALSSLSFFADEEFISLVLSVGVGIFPAIWICFTLYYGIAEGARGYRSVLRLSRLKNAFQGLVFRRAAITWS